MAALYKRGIRVHASCVLVGEGAVLVRGPAGSGKTALCLALIEQAQRIGVFSRLVADDAVALASCHGRLLARSVPEIEGLVERRGLGLTPILHEQAARVRLVVDCQSEEPTRLPEAEDMVVEIQGVTIPRLAISRGALDAALVMAALGLFGDEPWFA
jgi:serine kinase of HPr protein (carbohydrate metabolism regulator)